MHYFQLAETKRVILEDNNILLVIIRHEIGANILCPSMPTEIETCMCETPALSRLHAHGFTNKARKTGDGSLSYCSALGAGRIYANGTIAEDLPRGRTINLHKWQSVGGAPTLEILDCATGTSI
jgi:hypothetical protein